MQGPMGQFNQMGQAVQSGQGLVPPDSKQLAAAKFWAGAKAELVAAHEARNQAEARLASALQAEQQAWATLEEEAGRAPQKAISPNGYPR